MSERSDLVKEVDRLLRSRGVSREDVGLLLDDVKTNFSRFSLHLRGAEVDDFLETFKRVLYFALFAHAPSTPDQAKSKFAAWEWVKEYAKKYLDAPQNAEFDRRVVIGGMANVFDRSLIAMGRIRYSVHWPEPLRSEFISLWQTLSESRMQLSDWDLGPSRLGSPSKRFWNKVKAVAEAMKACRDKSLKELEFESPEDGPDVSRTPHEVFGHWSSSDDEVVPPAGGVSAPKASSPVCLGGNMGSGTDSTRPPSVPEGAALNQLVIDTMKREAHLAINSPLEGWPESEQRWAISTGRQYHTEGAFAVDVASLEARITRSETDIITMALIQVGAKRVPSSEFWTLNGDGGTWDVL